MENQKAVHEEHPELMHYTGVAGLYGIVASKTLWASHAAFLNDSEEVVGFEDHRLPMILKPELKRYVAESIELTTQVEAASRQGYDLLDQWWRKYFEGFKKAQGTQDHYVTSFCTVSDKWISQNGLLSQWRGYGSDGGYAIVFDTERLSELLAKDAGLYHDSEEVVVFGDVQYDEGDGDFSFVRDKQVLEHIKRVTGRFAVYLRQPQGGSDYDAFDSVTLLSTFWKHRGFQEEQEVRIVVSEPSPETQSKLASEITTPFRRINSFLRNGITVPCIYLFEDQKLATLPIRRIIVGPHPDKLQRKKAVEILLRNHGINADVSVSVTPFRGK